MDDERSTDLLSSLPRTRPHRRSNKRGAPPAEPAGQNAPDAGKAPGHNTPRPRAPERPEAPGDPQAACYPQADGSRKGRSP